MQVTASQWPSRITVPASLWRKETALGTEWGQRPSPDGAAEDGPGHSRAGRAGDPQPTSSSSLEDKLPAMTAALALEFQELSLLSWKVGGTEPIPWGSEVLQTGCWLRKWHLPRRKTSSPKGFTSSTIPFR